MATAVICFAPISAATFSRALQTAFSFSLRSQSEPSTRRVRPFSPDCRRIASVSEKGYVTLWEMEGEKIIGNLRTGVGTNPSISFSDIGTGITVFNEEESRSWEMVPHTVSSLDANPYEPMAFVTVPQGNLFQHRSFALYKYGNGSEWITDRHNRRVLWLPADLRGRRSCCQGSKVAIGIDNGRVVWFDFGLLSND